MAKLQFTILFTVLSLAMLMGAATNAFGAAPKKPVICTQYEVLRTAHRVVALCTDSKKPRFLVRFREVTIDVAENDTDVRKVLIGYTAVEQ